MEKWRVASRRARSSLILWCAAIACVSSRHEFTRGGELIRAFLSLPSSHLCISVLPFLPLFFTVSRAISHLASFSPSFPGDNRSIVRSFDQQLEKKFYRFHRFLVSSRFLFTIIFSPPPLPSPSYFERIFPRKNLETKRRMEKKTMFEEATFDRVDRGIGIENIDSFFRS